MQIFKFIFLLLIALHHNVAQNDASIDLGDNATDITTNGNTTTGNETNFIPSESPTFSFQPTEEGTFNDTELDSERPTEVPEQFPPVSQPPPPPQRQPKCRSLGIYTQSDCQFACMGFPFSVQYETAPLPKATGDISKFFVGFQCQCLQAVPPVNCIFHYEFRSCHEAGVFNCNQEAFPVAELPSKDWEEIQPNFMYNNTFTNHETIELEPNSSAFLSVVNATSCAAFCRDLGFIEDPNDVNGNAYDSLCTRNDPNNWTSCACDVVILLDAGRSVSILDGMYVCGDAGFEEGLTFDTFSGTATTWMSGDSWRKTIPVIPWMVSLMLF
ncbi:hypothetical protein IV203_027711 [Nitzschia inconspicua]|uniref:Uncharacterized protein n=1 Tax=Nitzschia inconspicua TaxID=303405 RepID=A0A9K3LWX1_9STRA|nr:hypothetical protein IV203_027711 [Nitzschia inconspicua]